MNWENQIANLLRSIETLAQANSVLLERYNLMRDALLHVSKACDNHPGEADQLLSESFVQRLEGLRDLLN
jgi:hypothetical protein